MTRPKHLLVAPLVNTGCLHTRQDGLSAWTEWAAISTPDFPVLEWWLCQCGSPFGQFSGDKPSVLLQMSL